jgi:hypothetical protein
MSLAPRDILIQYLLMKVQYEDWHGVSDAANDLRELDAITAYQRDSRTQAAH